MGAQSPGGLLWPSSPGQGSGQASGRHSTAGLKWDLQLPDSDPAELLMVGEVQSSGTPRGLRMELRGQQRVDPSGPQLLLGVQGAGLEVEDRLDWQALDGGSRPGCSTCCVRLELVSHPAFPCPLPAPTPVPPVQPALPALRPILPASEADHGLCPGAAGPQPSLPRLRAGERRVAGEGGHRGPWSKAGG